MMENNRRKFLKNLAGLGGLATAGLPTIALADSGVARIENIRLAKNKGYIRLVFDLSKVVEHSIFTLHNPERIVLDLKKTTMSHGMVDRLQSSSLIQDIRSGVRNRNDLRIVFDLNQRVTPRSFLLGASAKSGNRLVLDFRETSSRAQARKVREAQTTRKRDVIVAIDAGHGGKDPGATGHRGTHEKLVTLQIARRLEKSINAQRGMRAVLIRKNDYFMHLRERIHKAREYQADMMISVHADAFPDPRARGSSIYALSLDGASSEAARLLANNENASDQLFGDVNVAADDKMVKKVLFDLSLTGTIESSLDMGGEILKQIKRVNRIHKKRVQQAGFAVLKAPNIPSVLLETAFISNPREERNLRNAAYQKKVAKAITRGVSHYFVRKAPPDTWLSEMASQYKIKQGDTVASIAKQYDVSTTDLCARNALSSERLIAGRVIKIPVS